MPILMLLAACLHACFMHNRLWRKKPKLLLHGLTTLWVLWSAVTYAVFPIRAQWMPAMIMMAAMLLSILLTNRNGGVSDVRNAIANFGVALDIKTEPKPLHLFTQLYANGQKADPIPAWELQQALKMELAMADQQGAEGIEKPTGLLSGNMQGEDPDAHACDGLHTDDAAKNGEVTGNKDEPAGKPAKRKFAIFGRKGEKKKTPVKSKKGKVAGKKKSKSEKGKAVEKPSKPAKSKGGASASAVHRYVYGQRPQPDLTKHAKPAIKTQIQHRLVGSGRVGMVNHAFAVRMSPIVTADMMDGLMQHLHACYVEWQWSWRKQGADAVILAWRGDPCASASVQQVRVLDSMLPWYVIPVASSDTADATFTTNSAIMLKLHATPNWSDDLTDLSVFHNGKRVRQAPAPKPAPTPFRDLIRSNMLQDNWSIRNAKPGGSILLVGPDGPWKDSLLNHIMGHALATGVQAHVVDAKGDGNLLKFGALQQVPCATNSLAGAYECIKQLMRLAAQRYQLLQRMQLQHLRTGSRVQIGSRVSIFGNVFDREAMVHVALAGDEYDLPAQDVQPGMEFVAPGDKRFRIADHWELALAHRMLTDTIEVPPVLLVVNGWNEILQPNAEGDGLHLSGFERSAVDADTALAEITVALEALALYGAAVNMHLLLVDDHVNLSLLPVEFRSTLDLRLVLGDGRGGERLPNILEACFMNGQPYGRPLLPNELYLHNVNYGQVEVGKIYSCSLQQALRTVGVKSAQINKILKKDPKIKNMEPMYLQQYEGTLPELMPKGVKADYGLTGQRREELEVTDAHVVQMGHRKIVINRTPHLERETLQMEGVTDGHAGAVGNGQLPELTGLLKGDVAVQQEAYTLEDLLREVDGRPVQGVQQEGDAGRVDTISLAEGTPVQDEGGDQDAMVVVGDQSSLNGYYSAVVDDDGEMFHIVK